MKQIETMNPSSEELLADFKHEHIRFQFYHYSIEPRLRLTAGDARWAPAVDCYDTSDLVVIEVDLAGVVSDEVQIRFGRGSVDLSGYRQEATERTPRYYHVMEIERGKFERIIELPSAVDCKKAEATFENGMLILRLPKIYGSPFAGCSPAGSIKDFDE
ncbi:Hsp20/alpha crystallin family protein [bacterium]|nr:Hsp20/alpha crystallin family protein [bacterium]MBU1636124.1 Hsp20/alpha crystallin family protein [bacterium]MBU1919346.1 Hsp20/alpha crystallin family protein [bacterium]